MKPRRIQLRRTKGWRMPPNTVKVDRTTRWGNPFKVGPGETPHFAVSCFMDMLREGKTPPFALANIRDELGGKNLACWCPLNQECHADVLLAVANGWKVKI